jgi:hypothetical protein
VRLALRELGFQTGKYHGKKIEFRELPILKVPKAGSRASGKGELMISTNGKKGRAKIYVQQCESG